MTVWVYTRGDEIKIFATAEAAQAWFDENDTEESRGNIRLSLSRRYLASAGDVLPELTGKDIRNLPTTYAELPCEI
jgi:hypothetical protein